MPHAFDPVHPHPTRLADVAAAVGARSLPSTHTDVSVTGVAVATEDLRPGWLFVAVPGRRGHGARHADAARAAGAVAVLTDTTAPRRQQAPACPPSSSRTHGPSSARSRRPSRAPTTSACPCSG